MTQIEMSATAKIRSAVVTGGTGFIGGRLIAQLLASGVAVRAIVRPASADKLTNRGVEVVAADLEDPSAIAKTIRGVDVVFHLAGATRAIDRQTLWDVNESGTDCIARACAAAPDAPPTLIVLSSLAAAGPNVADHGIYRPRIENDPPAPVSDYGRSKLAGERAARRFAAAVPVSILRPPIVLGPGDHAGLEWFKFIRAARCFAVIGRGEQLYSVVMVDDLIAAMVAVAGSAERCGTDVDDSAGTFHVADPEVLTFKSLNRKIAASIGRPGAWALLVPTVAVPLIGTINDVVGRMSGKPPILGRDKAREATAVGWACDPSRLIDTTGWRPAASLDTRLAQTVDWYREHHWL